MVQKNFIIFIIIFFSLFVSKQNAFASLISQPTINFGGTVITTMIPGVVCTGLGYGPIIIKPPLSALADAALSSVGNDSTAQKIGKGVDSISKMIPYFATNLLKKPKMGKTILGKANLIPNFTICKITVGTAQIPFPVRKTKEYGIGD